MPKACRTVSESEPGPVLSQISCLLFQLILLLASNCDTGLELAVAWATKREIVYSDSGPGARVVCYLWCLLGGTVLVGCVLASLIKPLRRFFVA